MDLLTSGLQEFDMDLFLIEFCIRCVFKSNILYYCKASIFSQEKIYICIIENSIVEKEDFYVKLLIIELSVSIIHLDLIEFISYIELTILVCN